MAYLPLLKKYLVPITLFVICVVGLILRFLYFGDATFGYDQARDVLVGIGIMTSDPIKILGPSSDIKGLFHGSLYWYLTAPLYYVANGSPYLARGFMIVMNMLNVFLIYYLAKKFFKKTSVALTSAYLFAISFEASQYARWLSNPSLSLLSVAGFYYGMWLTLHRKSYGVGLMLLCAAISMQFQFFLVYLSAFFIPVFVYYLLKNPPKTLLTKANGALTFLATFFYLPFVVGELKFNFQATHGLLGFFSKGTSEIKDFSHVAEKLSKFLDAIFLNISSNIISFDPVLPKLFSAGLLFFVLWVLVKKKKERGVVVFLFLWFISPGLFYLVEKNNSYFLNIGNIYPLILLTSYILYSLTSKISKQMRIGVVVLALGIITASNLVLITKNNKHGETLLSVQTAITLSDERRVLDWIYEEAGREEFSINTVTNPLFVNTTWAYLFDWYGRQRYGYMPRYLGYPQDGNFGEDVVWADGTEQKGMTHFLIIEPTTGIPIEHVVAYRRLEDTRGDLIKRTKIGGFLIEKRVLKNTKHFLRDDLMQLVPPDLLKLERKELEGIEP